MNMRVWFGARRLRETEVSFAFHGAVQQGHIVPRGRTVGPTRATASTHPLRGVGQCEALRLAVTKQENRHDRDRWLRRFREACAVASDALTEGRNGDALRVLVTVTSLREALRLCLVQVTTHHVDTVKVATPRQRAKMANFGDRWMYLPLVPLPRSEAPASTRLADMLRAEPELMRAWPSVAYFDGV